MSESGPAIFLSYASQDKEVAARICDALRVAGLVVWFDQSELRGGDAWDQKIRRQIKECALFVPLISVNTNARPEGYFRLEWKLAVDRSHLLADDHPFLFPVAIGDFADATARVPDKFRDVQWTRLGPEESAAALAARLQRLLAGEGTRPAPRESVRDADDESPRDRGEGRRRRRDRPAWLRYSWSVVGLAFAATFLWKMIPGFHSTPPASSAAGAHLLIVQARAMSTEKYDSTADDYNTAEGLAKQALEMVPNDAEALAFSSLLNKNFVTRGFDRSQKRLVTAREQAERAMKLAPDSIDAQYALAFWQRDVDRAAAEQGFRRILERQPDHSGALFGLSNIAFRTHRIKESQEYLEQVAKNPQWAPLAGYLQFLGYFTVAQFADADRVLRHSIALKPSANTLGGLGMLLLTWKGDADAAVQALTSNPAVRNETRIVWMTAEAQLCQRRPDDALATLDRLADDYIQDNWFIGPKAFWVGRAQALAGRSEAARIAWQAGLALAESRLEKTPENRDLHLIRGEFLALLGRTDEALREARAVAELDRGRKMPWFVSPARIYAALGRADEALPLLAALCPPKPNEDIGWPLTPALFKLDPLWDKIRDDPRIQALVNPPAATPAGESPSATTSGARPGAAPPPAAVDAKSIAVLPFENMSGEKDSEFFTDGIQEDILTNLGIVRELHVTPRISVMQYRGSTKPARPDHSGLYSWGGSWKPRENGPGFKALLADPKNSAPIF